MVDEIEPIRAILNSNTFAPIGMVKSTADALAEHPAAKFWRRRMVMSAWDILHDNFEDPHTITFMMTPWPSGVTGSNSGLSAYSKASRHPASPLPKGGSGMLAVALSRFLEAHQGVILTNKAIAKLVVEGGKCTGVECSDGSMYRADKAVLSTIHIKHLVEMAPRELWGNEFLDGVDTFHVGPAGFNTHYATTEPLKYPVHGGTVAPVHSTTLQSPARALSFENEITLGEINLDDPVLHIVQTSVADPTRAPEGMHTIRILGRQPWDLKNGGPQRWDEIKDKVADAHLKAVQRLAPNLTADKILARFITNPLDLERMNPHNFHGCCHGGTDGPANAGALRPVPGWAQHRMPITGLYQTGGTTHPGGGVTAAPGRNAAWVMLKDFGTSIEDVVQRKDT
jgi:phytoene dehydrogenase-like protein